MIVGGANLPINMEVVNTGVTCGPWRGLGLWGAPWRSSHVDEPVNKVIDFISSSSRKKRSSLKQEVGVSSAL